MSTVSMTFGWWSVEPTQNSAVTFFWYSFSLSPLRFGRNSLTAKIAPPCFGAALMRRTVPPAPEPSVFPHLPYFFDMCACVASCRLTGVLCPFVCPLPCTCLTLPLMLLSATELTMLACATLRGGERDGGSSFGGDGVRAPCVDASVGTLPDVDGARARVLLSFGRMNAGRKWCSLSGALCSPSRAFGSSCGV
jgi:hypothetical protein